MIIPVSALIGLLLPAVLGGDLRRLGRVRLRFVWVILTAFVAQVIIVSFAHGPEALLSAVHIATYVAAAYVLWQNRRVPGLPVLGAGALSNGITIALNGGTLPARPEALAAAGLTDDPGFVNSGVLDDPTLWFLGDVFAVPADWPLSNVFSIGDVLIILGATLASVRLCGTRWTAAWPVPALHRAPGPARHREPGRPSRSKPPVPRQRQPQIAAEVVPARKKRRPALGRRPVEAVQSPGVPSAGVQSPGLPSPGVPSAGVPSGAAQPEPAGDR